MTQVLIGRGECPRGALPGNRRPDTQVTAVTMRICQLCTISHILPIKYR